MIDRESMDKTMARYSPLVCPECKEKLQAKCLPIMEKLNKGKQPGVGDMMKLLSVLCGDCTRKIVREAKK